MTVFRVGMRVRIKWSKGWPELAGQEGVIVSVASSPGITGASEWEVAPDCWGTNIAPRVAKDGGTQFGPSSEQLEPLSDSNNLASWTDEANVWIPEHLREKA